MDYVELANDLRKVPQTESAYELFRRASYLKEIAKIEGLAETTVNAALRGANGCLYNWLANHMNEMPIGMIGPMMYLAYGSTDLEERVSPEVREKVERTALSFYAKNLERLMK